MRKSIVFTKLGTVKTDVFEHSIDSFFQLMHNGISQDYDHYGVKYDRKNKCYLILYDDTTYVALYGNEILSKDSNKEEIIKLLNKLCEIDNKEIDCFKDEETKKKEQEEKEKLVIRNGEKGIFNSDEDKKIYLNYLKRELKNKNRYKSELVYNYRTLYQFTALFTAIFDLLLAIGAIVTAFSIGFGAIAASETFSVIMMGVSIYGWIKFLVYDFLELVPNAWDFSSKDESEYKVSLLGKILGKILTKRKLKKQIKGIEESLKQGKVLDIKGVTALNEYEKQQQEKVVNPIQKSVQEVSQEFRKVQERINQVLSDVKQKEFSAELLNILDNYKKQIAESGEKGNYIIVYKNAINQLIALAHKVSETMRKEEQEQRTQAEFANMFSEVDRVQTRRANK
jgi:hypothetical protein